MGVDDICNTGLVLGLGLCPANTEHVDRKRKKRPSSDSEPALTLGLSGETCNIKQDDVKNQRSRCEEEGEVEIRVSCISGEEEDGSVHARKKLRLTKQQSALLEDSFNQHTTLNPKQKQALARQLRLRPRQVEVWFQNRRARTKLKQTEVECELLKKWCERLRDENRRLNKEVQELKEVKPLYMNMNLCPSCNTTLGFGDKMAPKTHFLNHFTNPSAACN